MRCKYYEEQKKDLMQDNIVEDDKMFKLEFDPRVIGNKILPDGITFEDFVGIYQEALEEIKLNERIVNMIKNCLEE